MFQQKTGISSAGGRGIRQRMRLLDSGLLGFEEADSVRDGSSPGGASHPPPESPWVPAAALVASVGKGALVVSGVSGAQAGYLPPSLSHTHTSIQTWPHPCSGTVGQGGLASVHGGPGRSEVDKTRLLHAPYCTVWLLPWLPEPCGLSLMPVSLSGGCCC